MKWLILLGTAWLVSCGAQGGPPATDMTPVGDGLKLIGYALVGVSVVLVLGTLLRPPPSP
ncbi:MAG: hypothetical protein V4584_05900 [Verrucomicrobiota bacterium]